MFTVTINDTPYRVLFHHDDFGTACVIFKGEKDDEKLYNIAYSNRSPQDNPCRAVGRKVSLTRALKEGCFDKETRTQFWNAYRAKTKH